MNVSFLGAGSWGLTLGMLLHNRGCSVRLWEIDAERASRIRTTGRADEFLPGIALPADLEVSNDIARVLERPDLVVFALPCQALRSVLEKIGSPAARALPAVSVIKGIESASLKRVSELLAEFGWRRVAAVSGPSLAYEVAKGMPTSVVAASADPSLAEEVQRIFSADAFRVYTNADITGVELGGALKNVVVIAAGIGDGLGLGANTKGALLTRGLAEITRLGTLMGADPLTFSGLSGMGDLITTAFSPYSRNRSVGEELARGKTVEQILGSMVMVAEGIQTAAAAGRLARAHAIEMPITEVVNQVLFGGLAPKDAIRLLLGRALKPERWQ